ncbi:class II aldolase/adducin family protein [Alkaliphilus pronyensis]|uniref:Class II aldolase/adducin family protein n=1 Tax=Alkaliphilus pronyensis TaxID=1482732 RepID=A0A6I0F9H2_9FIRM|nr:class II aldolase/adducin family protein [Alkaliphilus pronyensis]KAB3535443.1 class II aldolase/adducin family protein [Alkaliphilus pronyensis]
MGIEKEIINVGLSIINGGLVRGTWGNISICDGTTMWITPSAISYKDLKEGDIAVIQLDTGIQIGGRLKPSSEMPLHIIIYKSLPHVKAIVHTHSVYATAFAAIGEEVPCYTEDQAQIIGGSIPLAKYALPGTTELALEAVDALKKDVYAALLERHGLIAVGRSLKEAITVAEIAEKSAELAAVVRGMDKEAKPLPQKEIDIMRKMYIDSYSKSIKD